MANRVPYYFFSPTWDYPPGGPIKIGNVITSVTKPESPLHTSAVPTEGALFTTEKRQVEFSLDKLKGGQFSILAKFMSVVGIGVDLSMHREKSDSDLLKFERLETTQIFPEAAYLQSCIEAEPVRRYLEKSRFRKPVYIITGLKTVMGASAKTVRTHVVGGSLAPEIDGTVWSGGTIPIGGGPSIGAHKEKERQQSWEGSTDFVFAFRVRKVMVKRSSGAVKSDEDYQKGALLGHENENASVSGLYLVSEEEPNAEQEGLAGQEMVDDNGDAIVCCAS